MAARMAARGRLAHQMCRVEMWPWRMDFSRALWREMASSGSESSMRRLLDMGGIVAWNVADVYPLGPPPKNRGMDLAF